MAIQVKFRRGTATQHNSFTGANGEITVDTTNKTLRIHDGVTVGGIRIAKFSEAGGNTSSYLQVANAAVLYTTKAYAAANSYVKSTLANTNSFIATKLNTTTFNSALANTNSYIASRASWSALTATNTAIRVLISDRLQVANAVATYQTKTVERAALANTNLRINLINTNLTATNTAIRTLVSNRMQVSNVNTLLANKASWTALTGTNTALRTLISDRMQVANTNTLVNGRATWAALAGTNTAVRTLISDRLQVANAAATYQTKTIERAALANTNSFIKGQLANTNAYIAAQASRITLVNTNLLATNTALRSLISSQVSSVIGSSPDALNTLQELANALGNNANFATATTNLISTKISVANTKAYLANTNAFIKTQLANTNLSIATKASWTALAGTNTSLRTLVSDRLQVANAATIYQTKTIERAALANTNLRVNLINTNLTGTNTALRTLISDRIQVANARSYMQVANVKSVLANTNAYIATKVNTTTFNAALANTNAYINSVVVSGGATWSSLSATNTALRTLISNRYQVANVNTLLAAKATWTALTGTNTAIRALVSDRYQVANVNTLLAAKATWTALTTTNTALRLLIADRLQVANAVATYQTKAIERAALANTNLRINLINTNLTGTNTALRLLINDRYQVANVNTLLNAKATWAGLTGTNTAIRTLVSDRYQVANVNTLLAAKATWAGLTATNTALRTLISDRLQVANASTTYLTKNNPVITGTLTANGSTGTSGYYLRTSGAGIYWSPVSAGGGSAANGFSGILVGANVVSADSTTDRLTLVAGSGITIAANPATDTITFASTGAGGTFTGGTVSGATTFSSGVTLSSTLTAGASVGTSGQALISTGTGVQWGALSPGYNYSSQFVGAQSLNAPSSTTWQLAGNFTIECWLYRTGTGDQSVIVQNSGANYLAFNINAGTGFNIYLNSSTPSFSPTDIVPLTNRWNHIALVRNGSTVSVYLNGVASATTSTNSSTIGYNLPFYIGCYGTQASGGTVGYISNLRVTSTAVYTANFTPSTTPLSTITGTLLLTCNSITPADSSTNNFQITNNGGVTTSAVQSPFTSTTVSIPTASLTAVRQQFTGDGSTTTFNIAGGYTPSAISVFVTGVLYRNGSDVTVTNGSTIVFATAPLSGALIDVIGTVPTTYSSITPVSYSVGFNGSSQYLSVPDNTAFDFGSGNFTVDCWVYLNSAVAYAGIITKRSSNANYGPFQLSFGPSGSAVTMFVSTSGSSWAINTGATISIGAWYHVAMVRNGTTVTLYLNGLSVATGTATGALMTNSVGLAIGSDQNAAAGNMLNGYISNMRVVKGVAVYTNNFTVPSSPLAITQSASGAYIQAITGTQTSLLTCNAPTIIDGSTNAFTITNNGSAPVSTAIVPTFTNVTINAPTLYYPATYLIVGGGGGGGGTQTVTGGGGYLGGGGGAGGLLTGITTLITGTTCTVTVGSGGAAGTSSGSPTVGSSGTNSVVVTSTTITAIGGGGGGYGGSGSTGAGVSGGSGGGAGSSNGAGGSGTSGQGFAGGTTTNTVALGYASGGGGSSAVGTSANSGSTAVNAGGAGTASSITGTSVTYAAGGNSGGGSTNATTNTGNGGPTASSNGGAYAGGSGVVILSIPTVNYTGRTTGSPTVTTNGIYTVLTFTASGSYTA